MRRYRILEITNHKGKIIYRVQMGDSSGRLWVGCSVTFDTLSEARKEKEKQMSKQTVSTRVVE